MTYPLVEAVAAELHGTIWHYSYAITAITAHEPLEPFFSPHLRQCLWYVQFVVTMRGALDLEKDL